MKKVLALMTPIALFLVFVIAFVVVQANQPQNWEMALERYLAHERVFSSTDFKIQTVVKSQYPWNFTADMSAVAIAESVHFNTIGYKTSILPTATSEFVPEGASDGGKAPLPYPPTDLWCVLLSQNGDGQKIVFVALHQDIYNAEIVVHEPQGQIEDKKFEANLAEIGCELP